ncbi:MAG: hypothetical protein PVH19_10930, partial [Planctomycetia bacterium]
MTARYYIAKSLLACIPLLFFLTQSLLAAIIIDPNDTGANDIDPADPTMWTHGTSAYIGKDYPGDLLIDGASQIESGQAYLGYNSSVSGITTISGTASSWLCNGDFYVGHKGNGILLITDGGSVSNDYSCIGERTGSSGTVTVLGTGSIWNNNYIDVGGNGNGTLNILDGGTVFCQKSFIASSVGSIGNVTVDGPNSTWTIEEMLFLPISGTGSLNIQNGGKVIVNTLYDFVSGDIYFNNGTLEGASLYTGDAALHGTGTVLLHGVIVDQPLSFMTPDDFTQHYRTISSQPNQNITINLDFNGSGHLGAGYKGTGYLEIGNGMTVPSQEGYISYGPDSNGSVLVHGNGTHWANQLDLVVGYQNPGRLDIQTGATVSCKNGAIGGTSIASVDGNGSSWINSNNLDIGGTLDIINGGLVRVTNTTTIGYQGAIHFNGGTIDSGSLVSYADESKLHGTGTLILHSTI